MGLIAQEAELVSPGLVDETLDYEEVVIEPEHIVQKPKQKTEAITTPTPKIELVDGKYVQIIDLVKTEQPVFTDELVWGADGSPVMIEASPAKAAVVDEEGKEVDPAQEAVFKQLTHKVPVYEGTEDVVIPAKTERRLTGGTTKSVKYSILYMKAVKALQENMLRTELLETENAEITQTLTTLAARLDALERKLACN